VTPAEFKKAQRLLQGARVVAEWAKAPSADEVRAKDEVRLLDHAALVQPVTEDEKAMVAAILDRVGPDQAAAAFARLWREGRSAPEELMDLSGPAPAAPKPRGEFGAAVWYAINVGRAGRAEARWLLPKICDAGGITKDGIGAIRVQEDETFVQIAVALAPRFGEGMELEPGVTLRRIAGEPNLDAPVKPRAKPREGKPHEPRGDRKVYTPKPLRIDEGEAEFAAAPAAAPAPVRSAAPAPRPLREDSAPVPRKPYDPDRKPFDPDRKPFVKRDTVAKPYAKRDDTPKSYAKPHATLDDAPKPYAKRTDAAKPYAKAADAPRKPYVKRDDAAAKPYAKRDGDAPKSYPKRDDAAAKPYAKPADGDRKPFVKRADATKPAARRAEGEAPKPRWQPPKSGGADARPPRPKAAAAAGGKPAFGKAAGSKSHTKPAFGKKPAPRPADPSDTSKRFVPPKKPQG
jgi:ATP-dependent RNA helicase DeaD